ncbi:hypothetical protein MZK49_30635, partial [Ensifer sesbaniae]|uniref:hypothetical protein n=1 Tax=Ensifer sesbaniae TaxID=1214071 RepID=UPI002001A25C|nr:hypothetical protein [Ensifer sesbaniae]
SQLSVIPSDSPNPGKTLGWRNRQRLPLRRSVNFRSPFQPCNRKGLRHPLSIPIIKSPVGRLVRAPVYFGAKLTISRAPTTQIFDAGTGHKETDFAFEPRRRKHSTADIVPCPIVDRGGVISRSENKYYRKYRY